MSKFAWIKLIAQNRKPMFALVREGFAAYRASRRSKSSLASARLTAGE
jgi:hypothetical protein